MAKHIHIHLPVRTRDAGTAHDPGNGQFTSGAGQASAGGAHHSQLKPGDHLHDKHGNKVDEVESVGKAMHANERTVNTRAGYAHVTQGGVLKGHYTKGEAKKPNFQASAARRQQEIDRAQSEHAKRTGRALPRHQAALLVANNKK